MRLRHLPIAVAWATYAVLCAILYSRIAHVTDGRAIYPLDDTYIQAAIGRNLAFYHTYGISQGIFATASSSILWPFLLALAYKVIGLRIWIPLGWNILFAAILLAAADRIIQRLIPLVSSLSRVVFLLAILVFSSMTTMTFVGMEHTMQAVSFVLFLYFAGRTLERTHASTSSEDSFDNSHITLWLIATASFNTLSRFEGAFVVAIVCILLFVRRRFLTACAVALSGVVPLAAFALFSIRHGGHMVPNSLLMKAVRKESIAHRLSLHGPNGLLGQYSRHQGLDVLWFAALLLLVLAITKKVAIPYSLRYSLGIYAAALPLQCQFSRLGFLGRYEFYLIVAGLVFCGSALLCIFYELIQPGRNARPWLCSAGAFLLLIGLMPRVRQEWVETVRSAQISYADTVQDARFLRTYYDNASIVASDVGAISYFTHVRCLDIAALGSNDVTNLVLQNNLTRATADQLAHEHNARIALVFKRKFYSTTSEPDVIPTSWKEVGYIEYPDAPGLDTTHFMAVNPTEANALRQNFMEFIQHLPSDAHPHMVP